MNGASCKFSHSHKESSVPLFATNTNTPVLPSAPVCRYFLNGFCNKGENCFFQHPSNASLQTPENGRTDRAPPENQQIVASKHCASSYPVRAAVRNYPVHFSTPNAPTMKRPAAATIISILINMMIKTMISTLLGFSQELRCPSTNLVTCLTSNSQQTLLWYALPVFDKGQLRKPSSICSMT